MYRNRQLGTEPRPQSTGTKIGEVHTCGFWDNEWTDGQTDTRHNISHPSRRSKY